LRIHRLVSTLAALALILLLLGAAGCGGDDDDSASDTESVATETSGGDTTASETGSIPEGYSGVEAELPTAYEAPEMQEGTTCKIGFQNPVAANEFLGFVQKAVIAEAKGFGCTVIALDDALNQLDPRQRRPRAGRVALVEDQVQHLQHGGENDVRRGCGRILARFLPHSLKP
jgi:ABC-type sugar transport system substrate-binding protein